MIKVLFIGDICGKPGRKTVAEILPELRKREKVDLVIANVENIAHGKGVTEATVKEIMSYGVDFMTSGNHIWKRNDFEEVLSGEYPIIRPLNYPDDLPGKGWDEIDLGEKGKLLVVNIMGWWGMNERTIVEPFRAIDVFLRNINVNDYKGIFVDMHAESTAEKVSMGAHLDGKVSVLVGTHTHIPTADERVLPNGTGYITDVGMVGPLNSVLWVDSDIIIKQNMYPYSLHYEIVETGPMRFDAVILEIEEATAVKNITRVNKIL
jgi:2',3'-cyclic-nucleotide 2'-phosphodiesterase